MFPLKVKDLGRRLDSEYRFDRLSFIYIGRSVYVCLHISEREEKTTDLFELGSLERQRCIKRFFE